MNIDKYLAPIVRRVRLMFGRGIIQSTDDSLKMQSCQVSMLNSEVRDNVEHFQNYGFTARAQDKAEAVYSCVNGNRNHAIVICVDDRRYRVKNLEKGEVCIYTDEDNNAEQHRIHFKRNKEIHMIAGDSSIVMTPTKITITTPELEIIKAT